MAGTKVGIDNGDGDLHRVESWPTDQILSAVYPLGTDGIYFKIKETILLKKAEREYKELKKKYQSMIVGQTHTINLISNIRLLIFLIGAGLGIYLIVKKNYGLLVWDIGLFLVFFIPLMILHENYLNKKRYTTILHKINADSLKRLHGEWNTFNDDGVEFLDDNHIYSQDLDIFGKGSLFQFINTAITYLGRLKFRDFLISPARSTEEISGRQEAVIELSQKLDWRQRYMAEGMADESIAQDPEALFLWGSMIAKFYRKPWVIFAFRFIPIITIGTELKHEITGSIKSGV